MRHLVAAAALLCTLSGGEVSATVLFGDEMASGAGWSVNASSADSAATFGYDYSADAIPEAPNTQTGDTDTTGLKMEANLTAGVVDALTVYPDGQTFTGDYQLRFDAWMNYDADERVNGLSDGTTEMLGGGVGYDGTTAEIGSGAQAIASGDGGSSSDWRAYKNGTLASLSAMAAATREATAPYYADELPGRAPPAGQAQVSHPVGISGSPGFQWIVWLFTVTNSVGSHTVEIDIMDEDGDFLRIASLDCTDTSDGSTGCTTEGNISLFYADFFSSVTARADLTFGLVDNVFVVNGDDILANPNVTDVPAPATMALFAAGLAGLGVARRRRRG